MTKDEQPSPLAAMGFTFEWPSQIWCDPSPIEATRLRNNLCAVDGAIKIVCVKSNAVSQRLCASQGLRIAPSNPRQATRTIYQIQIQRWPFPLAK
jgi:hypothetical protein